MLPQYLCRSQAFGAIFKLPKLIPLNFSAGASTYWDFILLAEIFPSIPVQERDNKLATFCRIHGASEK